jgi:hypothetical protein
VCGLLCAARVVFSVAELQLLLNSTVRVVLVVLRDINNVRASIGLDWVRRAHVRSCVPVRDVAALHSPVFTGIAAVVIQHVLQQCPDKVRSTNGPFSSLK